jgi:hypothetical protein
MYQKCGIHTQWILLCCQENKIMMFIGKYVEVEVIILNEIYQFHKDHVFYFICEATGKENKITEVTKVNMSLLGRL